MDCAIAKPTIPNSNISDIVSKFAKVCKLKSIGVFSSEIPNLLHLNKPTDNDAPLSGNSSDSSGETKCYVEKIHPQPIEVTKKVDFCGSLDIMKIFDLVSALKLAYFQLQEAHIPYDPDKIIAADEQVVIKPEKLCKFKRTYKEKQYSKARFNASQSDILREKIEAKETLLGKLKSQKSAKESEILHLRKELQDLEIGNKALAEKIKQVSLEKRRASNLSISGFHDIFRAASKSIHDFAKPLISLMKASGWDLDVAAKSIEDGVVYTRRSDKKYAFEAYIARRMFYGIPSNTCNMDDVMKFDDPIDALIENPGSDFAKFCRTKFLLVIHPSMEESFFGNLDHRTFILSGKHPRTVFYHLFAKMAKWVWVLLLSALSVDPNATMFYVNRGSVFSSSFMESVEESESAVLSDEHQTRHKVQFMIVPGFRIGQTFVKSRVYVSKLRTCSVGRSFRWYFS